MKSKRLLSFLCAWVSVTMLLPFSAKADTRNVYITMTEGETTTLSAYALSYAQYDVGDKTWTGATSNIVVLSKADYSAKILALSPGSASINHIRVYYDNGQKKDYTYFYITINKSSYPKLQITPSTTSNKVPRGTVLTLTPSVSGSTIYYSTSGSVTPGVSATFPSSGLTINSKTTVRAQAVKSGYPLSDVFEQTYEVFDYDFATTVAGGNKIYFKIISEANKTCKVCYVQNDAKGTLRIPAQLNGYSIVEIGDESVMGCKDITAVSIPSSVVNIGNSAFKGCTSLAEVSLQDGVGSIGARAFQDCTGLTEVSLPNGVKTLGANAFSGCTHLEAVTLDENLGTIGDGAFSACENLVTIYSYIVEPFIISDDVFTNYDSPVVLYVPQGCCEKYWSTSGWIQFANIEEMIIDGIENVRSASGQAAPIFSISGQRLTTARKGINIVGSRKVLVK